MEMYQPCVVSTITGEVLETVDLIYTTYESAANHYNKDNLHYRTNEVIVLEVIVK